jgi:hypothetical protein
MNKLKEKNMSHFTFLVIRGWGRIIKETTTKKKKKCV